MKIQKIHVQNFKAISEQTVEFGGCSAIITAGNNRGKSSLLKGLINRFRSEKPEMIVKEGESKGFNNIELTDGSCIEWKFTDKSESFAYITADGVKQTTGVLSAIGERYFGKQFDIDAFLRSSPRQQQQTLQQVIGLDLSEIEEEYREAYEARTEANRELKRVTLNRVEKPEQVEKPDTAAIKQQIHDARDQNEKTVKINEEFNELLHAVDVISDMVENTVLAECWDRTKAIKKANEIRPDQALIDIDRLEQELDQANEQLRKYDAYERDLKAYNEWVEEGKIARHDAEAADEAVKKIEERKKQMIEQAQLPDGFDFTDDGITYNGFILSENQISSSAKYIAALKLGSMMLGKIKTLHFDASTLDKNSLSEVQKWATKNDLQLLIERPDWNDGELRYEIIEEQA